MGCWCGASRCRLLVTIVLAALALSMNLVSPVIAFQRPVPEGFTVEQIAAGGIAAQLWQAETVSSAGNERCPSEEDA